jgi:hypothetical protein
MASGVSIILRLLLVAFIMVAELVWINRRFSRARSVLDGWASENRFYVCDCRRQLFGGRLFFAVLRSEIIYAVTVRDCDGMTRSGVVSCVVPFFGTRRQNVTVRWYNQQ